MHHLFDDAALSKSLAEKAFDQVSKYNWAETAQATLAVYQEVATELGVTSTNAPAAGGMLSNLASSVTNAASSSVNSVTQAVSNKASALQNQGKEAISKVTNRSSK